MNKATEEQIGGTHYKDSGYQPVQLFVDLRLNPFQANVVKYVTRHRRKNGAEDLRKAIHYCELAMELEVNDYLTIPPGGWRHAVSIVQKFTRTHGLNNREGWSIINVCLGDYEDAIADLNELMFNEYPNETQICKK